MAIYALLSPGGSPGVTTAALALTLGWPSQVILAECDPSGGDVLAGLLGGHLPASSGLLPLALEAGAGTEVPAETLWRQLVELDEEHSRLLLAGISDPRQSAALQSSLPWIAEALQGAAADVIADCGRLDAVAAVRPVLSAASLAVLVLRPTLRQLSRAVPRVEMLINLVGRERVLALIVGEGSASARDVAKSLGVPVAGQLAEDPKTAAVLSDGAGSRSRLPGRPLLRSAASVGRGLREAASAAGPLPGSAGEAVFTPYSDSELSQPGLSQPGFSQPGFSQPGLSQPGLSQPGLSQPGFPAPGTIPPGPGLSSRPRHPGRPGPRPGEFGHGHPELPSAAPGQPVAGEPALGWPEPDWPEPGWPEPKPGRPEPKPGRPDPEPGRPEPGPGWPEPGPGRPEPGPARPEPRPGRPEPRPGRHAAGRADDPEPARFGGTPYGGLPSARYLGAHFDGTQHGSSRNGTSANGTSANGSSPHGGPAGGGSPSGGRPGGGPAGGSGGNGGR
jgi:hypothetical protein